MKQAVRGESRRWRVLVVVAVAVTLLGMTASVTTVAASSSAPQPSTCTAPAWNSTASYPKGSQVTHNGHQWKASFYMWPGEEPGVGNLPPWWVPWEDLGPCGPSTTTTQPPGSTTTTTPGSTTTTTPPGGSVEAFYVADGPWDVSTGSSNAAGGVQYWYPSDLGEGGYEHPILTWGNGSDTPTEKYGQLLAHLASWGYVVVATNSVQTGLATEMLAAANWMVDQDATASSVFFGHLDTTKVGSFGHSQGAAGTLRAMQNGNGLVTSAAPLSHIDDGFGGGHEGLDYGQLQDPVFYIFGDADFITASDRQTHYNATAGPTVMGSLLGKDHFYPFDDDTTQCYFGFVCGGPGEPDLFVGYLTAWFKYTLEGDQFARGAFAGSELATDSAWTMVSTKNLP